MNRVLCIYSIYCYLCIYSPVFLLLSVTGPQPGLVPQDEGHVPGEQRRRRGTERDQEPAGEAGVHHEAGVQPVGPADGAQGAGESSQVKSILFV